KAREGIRVRLIYDWMGGLGKTSHRFWNHLRAAGVEVRCYNPPHFDSPFGWLSRDHRKMLAVDGEVGFITGLCVGRMWVGEPEKNIWHYGARQDGGRRWTMGARRFHQSQHRKLAG